MRSAVEVQAAARTRAPWRSQVARFWASQRWLVLAFLAAAAFLAGFVAHVRAGDGYDVALYRALQLFALNSEGQDPSWLLTVARFAAPLVAAAAAIQAAYALFREHIQLAGVRFVTSNHVIVVGLGNVGFRLALAFREAGYRVVVIERDPTHGSIGGCRERGIPVVKGDASDPAVLDRARVPSARHLIVTCGDDAVNLDVALAAARLVPAGAAMPSLYVHLGDLDLWRRLQAQVLLSSQAFGLRVEFFNVLDAAARVLLEEHPPFGQRTDGASRRPHVLFIGLDDVGAFAALHAALRWQNEREPGEEKLRLTVLGPSAPEQVEELVARLPELRDVCEIDHERVAIGEERFQRGQPISSRHASHRITAVYICLRDESDALTAALALRGLPATHAVPLVVTVWDDESGVASLLRGDGGRALGVTEFAVLQQTLVPDVTLLGTKELIARLRHEDYMRWELARGETRETNPSLVPWDELPESLRDSNRAFAEGVGRKLAASGCVLVPSPLAKADGAVVPFSDQEIEELARAEHERWMSDLIDQGWSYTKSTKDPANKLHPLLVPWEELSEVDRDRDRESIRGLARLLARAGFEICRVASPAGSDADGGGAAPDAVPAAQARG